MKSVLANWRVPCTITSRHCYRLFLLDLHVFTTFLYVVVASPLSAILACCCEFVASYASMLCHTLVLKYMYCSDTSVLNIVGLSSSHMPRHLVHYWINNDSRVSTSWDVQRTLLSLYMVVHKSCAQQVNKNLFAIYCIPVCASADNYWDRKMFPWKPDNKPTYACFNRAMEQ